MKNRSIQTRRFLPILTGTLLTLAFVVKGDTQFADAFDRLEFSEGEMGAQWVAEAGDWVINQNALVLKKRPEGKQTAGIALVKLEDNEEVTTLEAAVTLNLLERKEGNPWAGLIFSYHPTSRIGYIARISHREARSIFQLVRCEIQEDGASANSSSLASRQDLELDSSRSYRIEVRMDSPQSIAFAVIDSESGATITRGTILDDSAQQTLSGVAGVFSSQPLIRFDDFELKTR